MTTKIERRIKIKYRVRNKVSGTAARPRMSVFRSNKQIYVQIIDDLSGKTTEVLPGTNYAQLLENWNHANADKTPITINYASSSTGLSTRVQHIQEGKIDFILYDAISSEYIVKDQGYKLAVNKLKDDIGMKTDGLEYLIFSKNKQGKELKTFVNKRIKELKKDGTLAKLSKEYFGGDYVSDLK